MSEWEKCTLRIIVVIAVAFALPAKAQMALTGALDVSATGAATYAIPIDVPPGTARVVPKLTLQYSSQTGNGLLGVGWSLAGLSVITRCPQTWAQDNAVGGISYTAADRFCLDGERLFAVNGAYGADQTEYRTEREGFSKIVSYGTAGSGPAWFKVWTKAGEVMEFGNTADSRIEAQWRSSARVWALNKVSDTTGNYFSVSYTEDGSGGDYRPNRIDYTGNTNAGTATYASVRFTYEARPDSPALFQAGGQIQSAQRLTRIKTYVGESVVRDYQVGYDASSTTQRSRIVSVSMCDAGGICVPPMYLNHTTTALSFTNPDGNASTRWSTAFASGPGQPWTDSNTYPRVLADMNGDGLADVVGFGADGVYVALSTGSNFGPASIWVAQFSPAQGWSNDNSFPRFVIDVNGDGLPDVVGFDNLGVVVSLNTGTSLAAPVRWSTSFASGPDKPWIDNNTFPRFVLDMNGDGRPDIVGFDNAGVVVALNTGASFAAPTRWSTSFASGSGQPWTDMNSFPRFLADVNGDGLPDIVGFDNAGVLVATNGAGLSFDPVSRWVTAYPSGPGQVWTDNNVFPRSLVDVNGDGLADIVGFGSDGVYVALSTGGNFAWPAIWSTDYPSGANQPWPDNNANPRVLADVNGDGLPDIVGFGADAVHVAVNNGGTAFLASTVWDGGYPSTPQAWINNNYFPRFLVDVNGDGLADIVGFDNVGVVVSQGNGRFVPDLITYVSNTIGKSASIVYQPFTYLINPFYTKDTGANAATFPVVDIRLAQYAISRIDADNGAGGIYRTSYFYVGAKANVQGRGFLGFRQVIARDEQTGIEQTTTYRQDFPFTGLVANQIKVKTPSGLELNRVENTYGSSSLGGTRSFVFLTQSVQSSKDLDGSVLPATRTSYVYDTYGNVTTVSVETGTLSGSTFTGNGNTKTTTNTYLAPDITNWILDRLSRAQVSSATP